MKYRKVIKEKKFYSGLDQVIDNNSLNKIEVWIKLKPESLGRYWSGIPMRIMVTKPEDDGPTENSLVITFRY